MNTEPSAPSMQTRSNPSAADITRRDFLSLTWKSLLAVSGLLGLGGLFRFLSYQPDPTPPTRFEIGSAEDYPPGSRTFIPEAHAVLLNTSAGFQALSLICPHLGCQVDMVPEGFACPCHGSRFGSEGYLERGPATQGLRQLQVEEMSDGKLVLITNS
jgi:cytochrome b6-f complex iron-sulfur subunit